MSDHTNRVRIKAIARALDTLENKVVFVGGATVSLYAEREVPEVRPTDDVDVIIELLSYPDRTALEEKLRSLGFEHDVASGIVCRYRVHGIIVDIMPTTNDSSIGFSNRWYPEGFQKAIDHKIDDRSTVKILDAPYVIATKWEAFKARGGNDGRISQDFEDIIFILEQRNSIWEEMNKADETLRDYLKSAFRGLLENPYYFEWIDAHVERQYPPATYEIIEALENFIA
jgi:predicted nucleotidyltransferase